MIGFEYYNPAKIVFGEGSEKNLAKLLKQYKVTSLLLVYSGDFIKTLGIYDEITKAVEELGISFSESGDKMVTLKGMQKFNTVWINANIRNFGIVPINNDCSAVS